MVDRLTPERRSWLMSRVASKHTTPELRVRRRAHAMGLRFRLHRRDLPGKPDLTFAKHDTVVFVHGCFWHRHPGCPKASTPKSRISFWEAKFASNVARDAMAEKKLREMGWRVLTIWECETKNDARLLAKIASIPDRRKSEP
jgi:DNA mismatch endonuclease, patch repair protein